MKHTITYILLLGILESILFYHNQLGINVTLFMIPLCIFLYFYLKKNDLIKNKKGFFLLIPILILSITYSIYNNVFAYLNTMAIPAFFIMMILLVVNPKKEIEDFVMGLIKVVFKPIEFLDKFNEEKKEYKKEIFHMSEKQKQITKAIIVVIPITIIILLLLSSADKVFKNLFSFLPDIWGENTFGNLIGRIIRIALFFFYVGASTVYWREHLILDEKKAKKINVSEYTMALLLTVLNVVYVVFDSIQISSLWLQKLPEGITYAEYARSGFFQLMFISVINLVFILLSKKTKDTKYIKGMSTTMIGLTLIIIFSSFYRMFLYEQAYGYTELRLGVYVILFTEVILLIPTVFYIFNSKINLLKHYIIIASIIYSLINCVSVDKIIAANNIHRYDRTGKIDIEYLLNDQTDNIEQLLDFYNRCEEEEMKKRINIYFQRINKRNEKGNILEYNYSKIKALELIKEKRD